MNYHIYILGNLIKAKIMAHHLITLTDILTLFIFFDQKVIIHFNIFNIHTELILTSLRAMLAPGSSSKYLDSK